MLTFKRSFTCVYPNREKYNDALLILNCRNGRWRGIWTLTCDSAPGAAPRASLDGAVKVQVHYYEDGNVQLQANKEHQLSIPVEVGVFE